MEASCIYISSGDEKESIVVISSDEEAPSPRRGTKIKKIKRSGPRRHARGGAHELSKTASLKAKERLERVEETDEIPRTARSSSAELFERHTEFALRLSLLDHTPGEIRDQFLNMGQGDEPPAKKCKWKWDTEDVSSISNKCLSDIGNKSRPLLIMRRRSSEDFFQREEIITDELPDLAVDSKHKSSAKKHQRQSSSDKLKHIHSDKHRTKHKSEKHRTPSRSDSVNVEKRPKMHNEKHRNSEKHRTKSLECDSSSQKHVISSKHRHKSEQNHERRISNKKDMKEKRTLPSDHKHRYSNHSNHSHHHSEQSHKRKIKDETVKKEGKFHVSAGSDCKDSGLKKERKVVHRRSDSLRKEQFLTDNELRPNCRDCISPRVLVEKRDVNSGGFDYGKKLLSEFLRTGGSGKTVESDITCAQVDAGTDIEYKRDADRDSCDGRSDKVSSTNMNLEPAGANLNLKFRITAEKKQHLASVLKRARIPSLDTSSHDSKRVRRVSADTSTNLIRLPSLPASDCASDCGSVNSSISNRHFLDALSDVQDDCVSIASGDKREDCGATEPQMNMVSDQMQNKISLRINECSNDRLLRVASPVGESMEVTVVHPGPDIKIEKTDPKIRVEKAESKLKTDDVLKSETPTLNMNKSITLSEVCAPKTAVSLPVSGEVLIPEKTEAAVPVVTEEDAHEAEAPVIGLEDMAAEGTDDLPGEDVHIESDSEDFHSCVASPCASNSIDTDSLPDLEAPVCNEDLDIFNEPASSLCGDGRVIHVPSCHPGVNSFLNLRSTYEFTTMLSNSIDAHFQEGHNQHALELMQDFTTSVCGPTRQLLEKVLKDVLCEDGSALKYQGYDLLMYVQQLHPPDHRCPFSRSFLSDVMDQCEKLLKGGGVDAHDSDILGIILAVQYCAFSLEAELMSRKLGSRREMGKSIIARCWSLETCYGRVENLISWLNLAVEFDNLVKSRSQSASDDNDANSLGFHMSLLSELQKLLSLAVAVSTEPSTHCARVGRSLYHVMDQGDDATGEKIRRSVSSPLLCTKVLEMLSADVASLCNMSEDFGKSCMVAELCYVADYFLALWKVEEENLEMPLHRRVLESCQPDHRKTGEMIDKFLVNVRNENSDLEDNVYIAQLECQLEALDLDNDLTNDS